LTLQNLDDFFKSDKQLDLTPESWEKVIKSRKIITQMMSDPNRIVYGINTGFGNFADKIISLDERKQLQINLVTSHAVGVGNPIPVHTAKRMMLLRINTLAKGRSGISPENLKRYIDAFNKNYIPLIPEKGTVGASGDLAPLSHLAVGMLGQGLAWDWKK
jgi:histidine ammonia-lyase